MRSSGTWGRAVACALAASSLVGPFVRPATARDCGDTVSGRVTLTRDLLCPSGHGLRLAPGATLDCNGHVIAGARQAERYGIYADGADDAAVERCVVEGFEVGIRLRAAARVVVRASEVRDNARYGIEITQGSSTALIDDSIVADNDDEGIHVSGDSQPTRHRIAGNTVTGNRLEGIYLLQAHGNTVSGNTVRDNGKAGIYVKESDDNRIERNGLMRNPIQLVFGARGNLVVGNKIRLAGVALLITGDDNTVRENVITSADIAGLRISGDDEPGADGEAGRRNFVVCNRITDNNNVAGNAVGALFDAGATPNTLTANVIVGNDVGVDATAVADLPIDATGNWWGCPAGPGAPGCDTAAGNVEFAMPLPASPPDADNDGIGDECDSCTDTDGDGHANPGFPASTCSPDNCPTVANPDQRDADGDGAGDPCDACIDTDGDGFADPEFPESACPADNCPTMLNADQADADGDGVGDVCDHCTDTDGDDLGDPGFPASTCLTDNCPEKKNRDQGDADDDGIGDACDLCTDIDGDGRGDPGFSAATCPIDNCPADPNPDQVDADGDGLGDVCDPCTDIDRDGLGIRAPGFPIRFCPVDNCPRAFNPDQANADRDGLGDACDPCTDTDGDGRGDPGFANSVCTLDLCPADPMADQTDTDGDGVGDACDVCTDSDRDGFADPDFATPICPLDNCPGINNRHQRDADHDGIGDACDPCADQLDADADGRGDACDPCTDTDRDGFADPGFATPTCPLDNCPSVGNPNQSDADHDGIGDACDPCTDSDGDGAADPGTLALTCATDNCPGIANADQRDDDANGTGDICECRAAAPGRCFAGGGSKRSDCLVEVNTTSPGALNAKGTRVMGMLRCRDGDPACDRDATADGRCSFGLVICFANDDPRLPQCRPGEMESFEVRRPQAERSGSADDRANAADLEDAASSTETPFAPGLAIRRRGKLVDEAIVVPAGANRCTRIVDFLVPAPTTQGGAAVTRKLKLIGWSRDRRRDADKLVLKCEPPP